MKTENGLWRVSPDGRMETTWRIRGNALWHDGQPFTAHDLLFSMQIAQDKELAEFGDIAYESVESAVAPDPQTFTVRWKSPSSPRISCSPGREAVHSDYPSPSTFSRATKALRTAEAPSAPVVKMA